jgi:hypothetical protein
MNEFSIRTEWQTDDVSFSISPNNKGTLGSGYPLLVDVDIGIFSAYSVSLATPQNIRI